ncbi:WD40/YVTN/BNR-like repeat-containing protein [Micromonospora sp. SL4-19]|uniref:WD40/YVTN/BNR-like repeat-containing protein n=1 Tax=Micromonospora sp. SL4-19 TaxID=3399129 RepID=UPI003A4E0020
MPDTVIEEMFAEFEATARETFRPPGVPEAQHRVRARRRRRRGLLAGVTALLLAGSAGGYAAAHRGDRPEPTPTPTVSPTPDGKVTERKVALPGVPGELTDLRFVDARTGWALFDTCGSYDPDARGCQRTIARTTDAGVTWRRTAFPAAPTGGVHLLPRDDETLTVMARDGYLVTVDGGATWTSHPLGSPPEATRRTFATPSGLFIGCPSPKGLDGGARGLTCGRQQVLRVVDGGALPHQPPVTLSQEVESVLFEGGDGRLWLTVLEGDRFTVITSDDLGVTWRKLPAVAGARNLAASPDGRDVWLVRTDRPNAVWRLVRDRWQQGPGLPDDTDGVAAVGGGTLAVTSTYGGMGFVADGRYVDVPELRDLLHSSSNYGVGVAVLPDGTVLVTPANNMQLLGTGRGVDRTWVRVS